MKEFYEFSESLSSIFIFPQLQCEHDELNKKFVKAVLDVQQKTGTKNVLLQKRIQSLMETAEQREALIGELSAACKEPPERANKKLEEILSKKNSIISDLQYELARVYKAHDDLLNTYEEKLKEYGITKEELGFVPLRVIPEGQAALPRGPAGLVTKNRWKKAIIFIYNVLQFIVHVCLYIQFSNKFSYPA